MKGSPAILENFISLFDKTEESEKVTAEELLEAGLVKDKW